MKKRNWTILLIDTDEDYRFILPLVFDQIPDYSFLLHWAAGYADALSFLEYVWPDLIIVDYDLDESNGLELLRTLQAHGRCPLAILITARRKEDIGGDRALEGLVDAYLSKIEFTLEKLKDTILRVMEK